MEKDLSNEQVIHVKELDGIEYLQFRRLLEYKEITHCFTMKGKENINYISALKNPYFPKLCNHLGIDREKLAQIEMQVHGDVVKKAGLNLLTGPGNDIVASTVLTAAGAHMILFTTGRGTPLGAPVPTVKISTNSALYAKKPHWIDFNAGTILEGVSMEDACSALYKKVQAVASGEQTNNEKNNYREISIFKDGVTL